MLGDGASLLFITDDKQCDESPGSPPGLLWHHPERRDCLLVGGGGATFTLLR